MFARRNRFGNIHPVSFNLFHKAKQDQIQDSIPRPYILPKISKNPMEMRKISSIGGGRAPPSPITTSYQLIPFAFGLLFSAFINLISLTVETTKRSFKRRRRDTSGPTYSSLPTFPRPPSYYFLSGNRPRHVSTTSAPASTGESKSIN